MKELCSCNSCATPHAGYVTPWCSLLNGHDTSCAVLHLWYKMHVLRQEARKRLAYLGISNGYQNVPDVNDLVGVAEDPQADPLLLSFSVPDIKEEVQKLTAYLGKFRRTEEAQLLLDLIALTDDEDSLFYTFAKEAMIDVWNVLSAPFVGVIKKAWWQDTTVIENQVVNPSIEIRRISERPNTLNTLSSSASINYRFDVKYALTDNETEALQRVLLEALVNRIIYKWLLLSYPNEAQQYDAKFQQALVAIPQRVNEFKARWSGLFIPFAKSAMADLYGVLNTYMPRHEKAYWFREGQETVIIDANELDDGRLHLSELSEVDEEGFLLVDNIPVDKDGFILIAEGGVDANGYIIDDGSSVETIPFHAGQYVLLKDELYMAIEDGSNKDYVGKLVPTEDYRDSVHYGILWRCKSNINAVEPLDTAIFEAIVARIIYKWVLKAYPVEADAYLAEYNENVEHIRDFARIMEGPQIVKRIPRMF